MTSSACRVCYWDYALEFCLRSRSLGSGISLNCHHSPLGVSAACRVVSLGQAHWILGGFFLERSSCVYVSLLWSLNNGLLTRMCEALDITVTASIHLARHPEVGS